MFTRDRYLEHLASIPLFAGCSDRQRARIARSATDVVVPAGRTVVQQGRLGYEFFVIVDGTATVTRDGVPLASLGRGDFFGELALLDATRRDATVTAETTLELLVIQSQELDALLGDIPALTAAVLRGAAGRRSAHLTPLG